MRLFYNPNGTVKKKIRQADTVNVGFLRRVVGTTLIRNYIKPFLCYDQSRSPLWTCQADGRRRKD